MSSFPLTFIFFKMVAPPTSYQHPQSTKDWIVHCELPQWWNGTLGSMRHGLGNHGLRDGCLSIVEFHPCGSIGGDHAGGCLPHLQVVHHSDARMWWWWWFFLGFCHGLILRYPKLGLIVWFSWWWIYISSYIYVYIHIILHSFTP